MRRDDRRCATLVDSSGTRKTAGTRAAFARWTTVRATRPTRFACCGRIRGSPRPSFSRSRSGIGCSCAIFSLVHGILVRPLPYARPNELVALWERNVSRGADRNVVSEENFAAWRARSRSFSAMAAMTPIPLTLDGTPVERITGAQVSPSYFRLLGAHPALGRDFTDADEVNGGTDVVILGDGRVGRNRFGANPNIVGRSISMDGRSFTVIGVMPPTFEPPSFGWMTEHPLWLPFGATEGKHAWGRFLHVIGRRRSDVSLEQARADLVGVHEQLSREIEADKGWSTSVVPLAEQIVGDVRKPLVVIFAAVLLLLAMSVVNVANLMITFTRRRQHELAVRRAIGATWSRLLRQQLVLSGTLGVFGTVLWPARRRGRGDPSSCRADAA